VLHTTEVTSMLIYLSLSCNIPA